MSDYKDYSDYLSKLENSILSQDNSKKTTKSQVQRKKPRRRLNPKALVILLCLLLAVVIIILIAISPKKAAPDVKGDTTVSNVKKDEVSIKKSPLAEITDKTVTIGSEIDSKAAVFIDNKDYTVVASKNENLKCYPASTTKIMTLLVAVENIDDLDDTFKMSYEITDPLWKQEATVAGFLSSEVITVKDMLYGTILPSGGDAAIGLAIKISGSEENFVELMNEKAKALGLKNTNFVNCTGLYNKNHYTTPLDLAVILKEAMKNELCREILKTQSYVSSKTPQHPTGITMNSTLFNYMYGTEAENAVIEGGKTGYTGESGYCIASFGSSAEGNEYICVALGASTRWPAVYDQIELYKAYAK